MKKPFFEKENLKLYLSEWQERPGKYNYEHSLIFPINTYSPWLKNGFSDFYESRIKENTLVDIYRCYDLYTLAKQYYQHAGSVLEVGVWRGGTGLILAESLKDNDQLYLCDTFSGVVKASDLDNEYKNGEHADTSLKHVQNLFQQYPNCQILQGIFPEETGNFIPPDSSFKLCHIDVDVYYSAKDVFEWVFPKMIIGGAIVFDDYGFAACEGVTKFVNELSGRNDLIVIYNINGHAIVIKIR